MKEPSLPRCIDILAHRANLAGPNPASENSLTATAMALAAGFGLETDLRRDSQGRFYIAHDRAAWSEANALDRYVELFHSHPACSVAMNVKELGYEDELIALQCSGALGTASFYFDFELLEPHSPGAAQRKLRALPNGAQTRLAARLSDRGESLAQCLRIPAEIVWADEFDALWLAVDYVQAVHRAGRAFYVISPELHGFDPEARRRRWDDFRQWGIDGLCTDYALEAREFFAP